MTTLTMETETPTEAPEFAAAVARPKRRQSRRFGLGLLTLFLAVGMLIPPDAFAAKYYNSGRKFRRGVSNMALGVLSIPGQMTSETRKRGYAVGLPWGFAKGIGYFVAAEAVGTWEFLTCPFQFPKGYRPILEPEFPWDYFRGPPSKSRRRVDRRSR
jgi:putative exosortase-associated protein (TIGR04073 family)